MALHKEFPESPYAILDPDVRWFPADEALRESSSEKLMPPPVPQLHRKVKEWRDSGYVWQSQGVCAGERSTLDVTMCRLPGLALSAAAIAALLLSVAHDVKRTSIECAPINSATCSRAVSITDFTFAPNLYALDGLPHSVVRYGIIASSTSGSTGVVALWSR